MLAIKQRPYEDVLSLKQVETDPVLYRILVSRGIKTVEDINCNLRDLFHYKDLKDIEKASDILADAVLGKKKILISGDYDVDGVTGTALGVHFFRDLGLDNIIYHVPSRYEEGYGLSEEIVDFAIENNVEILLTVDNGISCSEVVTYAKEKGLTVIITDHHEVVEFPKDADACVDPKREDCQFASKNLSGVGVLFYVLLAVRAKLNEKNFFANRPIVDIKKYLDFVATGTIGDVVELDANNRRLVKGGLKLMHQGQAHVGLAAIFDVVKRNICQVNSRNLAFELCPRINASGRLPSEKNYALECLLANNYEEALEYAKTLDNFNRRRVDYENAFIEEAKQIAQKDPQEHVVCVMSKSWLVGLVGIVSGRLKDLYNKPCAVFACKGKDFAESDKCTELTASIRSVPAVNILHVLTKIDSENPGLIIRYGGHAMAAGVRILCENYEKFRAVFDQEVALAPLNAENCVYTDGELPSSYFGNVDFARSLERLGPYGHGFEEPCFDGIFNVAEVKPLGESNLRFVLLGYGGFLRPVCFKATEEQRALKVGQRVRVVYTVSVNRYKGKETFEAKISLIEAIEQKYKSIDDLLFKD